MQKLLFKRDFEKEKFAFVVFITRGFVDWTHD